MNWFRLFQHACRKNSSLIYGGDLGWALEYRHQVKTIDVFLVFALHFDACRFCELQVDWPGNTIKHICGCLWCFMNTFKKSHSPTNTVFVFCFSNLSYICLSFELTKVSTNYDYKKHSWKFNTQWHIYKYCINNHIEIWYREFEACGFPSVTVPRNSESLKMGPSSWVHGPLKNIHNFSRYLLSNASKNTPRRNCRICFSSILQNHLKVFKDQIKSFHICYLKFCPVRNQTSTSNY